MPPRHTWPPASRYSRRAMPHTWRACLSVFLSLARRGRRLSLGHADLRRQGLHGGQLAVEEGARLVGGNEAARSCVLLLQILDVFGVLGRHGERIAERLYDLGIRPGPHHDGAELRQ